MLACNIGRIDIARMLVGECHANIDIQNTVRAIVKLRDCDGDMIWEHVLSSGGVAADINAYLFLLVGVLYSLSDFFDFVNLMCLLGSL